VRRVLLLSAVILTALILQTTVFSEVNLLGAKPELMYLLTICFAILEGPSSGAITGFAGGMAQDFLLDAPKGITALTLTLLGYAIGMARQYIVSPSPVLPVLLVAGGTFAGIVFYGIVSFLLGQLSVGWLYLFRVALLSAVYNAILTPLVFPLLRRAAEGSRSHRVASTKPRRRRACDRSRACRDRRATTRPRSRDPVRPWPWDRRRKCSTARAPRRPSSARASTATSRRE